MQPIRVALLGFGNVARAFARYLGGVRPERDVKIHAVADSSGGMLLRHPEEVLTLAARKESGESVRDFAAGTYFANMLQFIRSLRAAHVTILVEALPTDPACGRPALEWLLAALAERMGVVTVDKGPVVHGYRELLDAARSAGVTFAFTGTTGVRTPAELDRVRTCEISGVLNGTTNYILTEMQERALPFDAALAEAQAMGIAEPDPSVDLRGWDTACKILILAKKCMGAGIALSDVSPCGIGPETDPLIEAARAAGRVVRLVGRAQSQQGRVQVTVAPEILGSDSPFFSLMGTSKGAVFKTEGGREIFVKGLSGRNAIAQTILDDVLLVAQADSRKPQKLNAAVRPQPNPTTKTPRLKEI